MMFKSYGTTFASVSNGDKIENQVLVNKAFRAKRISFAGNSTNTMIDTIFFGLKIEDTDVFNPDVLPVTAFKSADGQVYDLPVEILIPEKKTLGIKIKNGTGSTLTSYTVVLHGEEKD